MEKWVKDNCGTWEVTRSIFGLHKVNFWSIPIKRYILRVL